jgi:hypothetical protein
MAKAPDYSALTTSILQPFQVLGIAIEMATEASRAAQAGPEPVDKTLDARTSLIREGAHLIATVLRVDAERAL